MCKDQVNSQINFTKRSTQPNNVHRLNCYIHDVASGIAVAMFKMSACMNHSCRPNTHYSMCWVAEKKEREEEQDEEGDQRKIEEGKVNAWLSEIRVSGTQSLINFWSVRDIKKGEEITHNYLSSLEGATVYHRQVTMLKYVYIFLLLLPPPRTLPPANLYV